LGHWASGSPEYASSNNKAGYLGLVSIFAGAVQLRRIASFFSESVLAGLLPVWR
jgi:hypothetical protein